MSGLESHDQNNINPAAAADFTSLAASVERSSASTGFSQAQEQKLETALSTALGEEITPASSAAPTGPADDHNHAGSGEGVGEFHIDLGEVSTVRQLTERVRREISLSEDIGRRGDFMTLGGGDNVAIGSGSSDVIDTRGGRFNTITTGKSKDTIIIGAETTNRILDFNPLSDRLLIDTTQLDINNLVLAQGKNTGKDGVNAPLDSVNNTLLIDKSTGHILASLDFVKASQLRDSRNIVQLSDTALPSLDLVKFSTDQQGDGKLTGTLGKDKLTGGAGDDFLFLGDDGFKFNTAKGGGGTEFPFVTDSPGTSELNVELKDGVLRLNGNYKDFDGAPLFSQGETELASNAKILNGSDPKKLIDGFLAGPKNEAGQRIDVEGNVITGTHLHYSPAGDDRGNFADATVVRFVENNVTDAKSGTLKGEFELTPVEQAALLAGNLYVNLHSNIDLDGDGRAGFATGENRINLNRNVVQFIS